MQPDTKFPSKEALLEMEVEESNVSEESESPSQVEITIDINLILERLLAVRSDNPGRMVELREQEICGVLSLAKDIFQKEPMLLELEAPIQVCGDIHGQYPDLLRLFEYGDLPPASTYLFLGDYVDRGQQGIETICLLYCLKIKYPSRIYLLRGNHESMCITRQYGFYAECLKRYNAKMWKCFLASFVFLPVAAVISERIICMHGGLSPDLHALEDIHAIIRPQEVPDRGILCDLMWADPTDTTTGWADSEERGCSYLFGCDVTYSFLKSNQLDLICRGHQVVEDGYQFCHGRKVVTLFSAPNYCGEFNNAGAFMRVEENLRCSFHILRPEDKMNLRNSKPKAPLSQ